MYTLLTTSADNIPDFYASGMNVTISDNFQNLLEEMPASEAYNMGIGVGIIGGIMIGIFLCLLLVTVVYFLRKENNEDVENNKTESENKPISNKNNDAKIIKYIACFLVVVMLIGTIVGLQNVDSYFKKDYESSSNVGNENKDTPTTKTRNATTKDIIANVSNMLLSVQASEKIKGLVIEIDYLDKSKNILKTDTINVGNIAPGNTFQHRLTKTGMQISDLDKLKSFNIRVINGTIEE